MVRVLIERWLAEGMEEAYGAVMREMRREAIHSAATTGDVSAFAQRHWMRDVAIQQILAMGAHFSVFGTEDVPYGARAVSRGRSPTRIIPT